MKTRNNPGLFLFIEFYRFPQMHRFYALQPQADSAEEHSMTNTLLNIKARALAEQNLRICGKNSVYRLTDKW